MLDFILLYIIIRYKGGLIIRIKIFPEFFLKIELLAINKGYAILEAGMGYDWGYGGTGMLCSAPNEFILQSLDCCHTYLGEL